MSTEGSATLDKPWTRSLPARALRELIVRGVFGTIIDAYVRQEVVGCRHLARVRGPAVLVANHCSHMDTPVLLRSLPASWRQRTVVAAAVDYFYARPSLAVAVSLAFGTVPLDRRSPGEGIQAATHIERLLMSGWNVVVFAEGTRSRDGRVGVLRSGAAVLAARCRVPIVPVHISGTHRAMPVGRSWPVRLRNGDRRARHTVRVSFGVPIPAANVEPLEAMESVRLFMAACGADTLPDPRLAIHRTAPAASVAGPAGAAHDRAL